VAETMGRLSSETDPAKAVKNADLVIEAIVENMDVKHKLFSTLDKAAPRSVMNGLLCIFFHEFVSRNILCSLNACWNQVVCSVICKSILSVRLTRLKPRGPPRPITSWLCPCLPLQAL